MEQAVQTRAFQVRVAILVEGKIGYRFLSGRSQRVSLRTEI